MSEQDDETGIPGEEAPETAPETPSEDETGEEEQEAGEAAEPAEEPAQAAPEGFSEKQLEAGRRKLDLENARHRKRIGEIIGEEAELLVECPLCSGFADGHRFPVPPPEDVIEATMTALGLYDARELEPASDVKQCPECKGRGRTKTGGIVGEFMSKKCATCKGITYVRMDGSPVVDVQAPDGAGDALTAPANGNAEVEPLVDALKARGYSVFPPVHIGD